MHFDSSIYHQHYCIASLIAIISNINFRRINRRKSFWVFHFFDFVQQSAINNQQSTISNQQSTISNQQSASEKRLFHLLLRYWYVNVSVINRLHVSFRYFIDFSWSFNFSFIQLLQWRQFFTSSSSFEFSRFSNFRVFRNTRLFYSFE